MTVSVVVLKLVAYRDFGPFEPQFRVETLNVNTLEPIENKRFVVTGVDIPL